MSDLCMMQQKERLERLVESGSHDEAQAAINAYHSAELRRAGALVEKSAFELAGLHSCDLIGQLITIAADLDRIVRLIEQGAPLQNDLDT